MSDSFEIRSGLKQGDALSPLLFNFALEYAILNTDVLVEAYDEIGLQVNVEKAKYMITSRNTELDT